jgi:hypothetical protein
VLPGWLEQGAEVDVDDGVSVSVLAPALLPGVPAIPIRAATVLDPLASDDG